MQKKKLVTQFIDELIILLNNKKDQKKVFLLGSNKYKVVPHPYIYNYEESDDMYNYQSISKKSMNEEFVATIEKDISDAIISNVQIARVYITDNMYIDILNIHNRYMQKYTYIYNILKYILSKGTNGFIIMGDYNNFDYDKQIEFSKMVDIISRNEFNMENVYPAYIKSVTCSNQPIKHINLNIFTRFTANTYNKVNISQTNCNIYNKASAHIPLVINLTTDNTIKKLQDKISKYEGLLQSVQSIQIDNDYNDNNDDGIKYKIFLID